MADFPIGSAVGAGMKIGASIFGGIKASQAMKKVKNNLNQQVEDNQNWYNQRYNEDATQRADAQRLLTQTEQSIRNRNQQAEGAQAVMGGTEESTAAAKEANNKALSSAVSDINTAADARKDQIEQTYQQNKSSLNSQLNNLSMNEAKNIQQAANGVADAFNPNTTAVGNELTGSKKD